MNIKIKLHEDYVIKYPYGNNDKFDQAAFDYRSNLLAWGCIPKRVGSILDVELINGVKLDINDFLFLMSKDEGDVENYGPWVKMLTTGLQNEVPIGISNRMKSVLIDDSDPENPVYEEQVKTWDEWIGDNYTKPEIEEYTYFLSYSGNKGQYLTAEELLIIHNLDYAELIAGVPVIEEEII